MSMDKIIQEHCSRQRLNLICVAEINQQLQRHKTGITYDANRNHRDLNFVSIRPVCILD